MNQIHLQERRLQLGEKKGSCYSTDPMIAVSQKQLNFQMLQLTEE